jgi:2-polyprenyl-3-methyl-5-hydroxy-6-metoxy-1,4-benzoquinol methylase
MSNSSSEELDQLGKWYIEGQLAIDKLVIRKRYEEHRKYFYGKTCLELGPAEGLMTEKLIDDFEELTVIEGSKYLLDQIKTHERLIKIHSLFEEVELEKQFDTIIADHIFEHVDNPKLLLTILRKFMHKESRLIIGVPNADSFHRILGEKLGLLSSRFELNKRDHQLGHQRVFDISSLEELVQSCGFKTLTKGGLLFKPLSFKQLETIFSFEQLDALFEMGEIFKENAAELTIVVTI